MPLINISPPRFHRFGPDALARTVAYLYSKVGPNVCILIRDQKIFLDVPIDKVSARSFGEQWRAELAALFVHEPALCPCGCGSDLVLGECRGKIPHDGFLTTDELEEVARFAHARYRGLQEGTGGAFIQLVKQVRIRTGLSLSDVHQRCKSVEDHIIELIKGRIPGGLTVDEYKFIERTVAITSDMTDVELSRLAVDVGQRIGFDRAFACVFAYAQFVRSQGGRD